MSITVAKFLDVSAGLQPGQFTVGSHSTIESLDELDPTYKQLLDEPIACVLGLIGNDGRVNMTPMWFSYEGSQVLLNVATHRKKVEWIRNNEKLSFLLVNPEERLPLGEHQVHHRPRDLRGRSRGGSAGHRTRRPDLDEVHEQRPAVRAAGPVDRRAADPVRVRRRPGRHIRHAVTCRTRFMPNAPHRW